MTIRVACLGAGYFAQFHHDGWARLNDVQLVGISDLDISKARATGHPAFEDLASMLKGTTPDILDIIVPPTAHLSAIETALDHGIRTIICQKPFCGDIDTAKTATDMASAAGATLIVHENFRFQPWFRAVQKAIAAGKIGKPLQATWRMRPGDGQGPDAYLARQAYFQKMPRFLIHETGVHYIDVFRFLYGEPTAVYADLRKVNPVIAGEDAGYVTFDHSGGVRCVLDANRCLDHAATNTRCTMGEGLFEGTEGTLAIAGDGSVKFRAFGAIETELILPPSNAKSFGGDCTYHLQAHVVGSLSQKVPLENSAENYLSVMQIEEAIYVSNTMGQKVILNAQDGRGGSKV